MRSGKCYSKTDSRSRKKKEYVRLPKTVLMVSLLQLEQEHKDLLRRWAQIENASLLENPYSKVLNHQVQALEHRSKTHPK